MITASLVTYENSAEELFKVMSSALSSPIDTIYIIDHSPSDQVKQILFSPEGKLHPLISKAGERVIYEKHKNRGFGAGHNIGLRKSMDAGAKYHAILNPDIYWDPTTPLIEELSAYLDGNRNIGIIAPKVLNPDNTLQYTCKLIPTPLDLFGRRFLPKRWMKKRNDLYELRFTGHDHIMDVPYLHGCFMMFQINTVKRLGLFDERFFMYPEDIDITRRYYDWSETIYYPGVSIYHVHKAESRKSGKMLWIHIWNIIKYFNKWGWIFDKNRRLSNENALFEEGYDCKV